MGVLFFGADGGGRRVRAGCPHSCRPLVTNDSIQHLLRPLADREKIAGGLAATDPVFILILLTAGFDWPLLPITFCQLVLRMLLAAWDSSWKLILGLVGRRIGLDDAVRGSGPVLVAG